MKSKLLTTIIAVVFCACTQKPVRHVLATIDGEEITNELIDKAIEQQLYDNLYNIYTLRRTATDEYLSAMVLDREAQRRGIATDSLVNEYKSARFTDEALLRFAQRENLLIGIPKQTNGIYTYLKYDSEEGQAELRNLYTTQLRNQLADSLKEVYNAEIRIQPPVAPRMNLDSIATHERGNLKSPIQLTEITDYNCEVCQSVYIPLEKLYEEFADRVCFRYSNLALDVSVSARAAEAAARQDAYWAMRDTLMHINREITSNEAFSIATLLNLDLEAFEADINDTTLIKSIDHNNRYLSRCGLYATPTILINNHIIRNATDIRALRAEIIRALGEAEKR